MRLIERLEGFDERLVEVVERLVKSDERLVDLIERLSQWPKTNKASLSADKSPEYGLFGKFYSKKSVDKAERLNVDSLRTEKPAPMTAPKRGVGNPMKGERPCPRRIHSLKLSMAGVSC